MDNNTLLPPPPTYQRYDSHRRKSYFVPIIGSFCILGLLALVVLHGRTTPPAECQLRHVQPPSFKSAAAKNADVSEIAKEVLSNMDRTASPCDNFYQYACGGWLERTPLPSDATRISRSMSLIGDKTQETLRDILDQDDPWPIIGPYYKACMDTKSVESLGLGPIHEMIAELMASVTTVKATLMATSATLHSVGVPVFFSPIAAGSDSKATENTIAQLSQGGLNLPSRDIYLDGTPVSQKVLDSFAVYVDKLFDLLGGALQPHSDSFSRDVLDVETALARISLDNVVLRDPETTYNKFNTDSLTDLTKLEWETYLTKLGLSPADTDVNVATVGFFKALAQVVSSNSDLALKNYVIFTTVHTFANQLSKEFVDARFEFEGRVLHGQETPAPRWKQCVEESDAYIGELLGRYFVKEAFSGDSKTRAQEMIHLIEESFHGDLSEVEWMDKSTKEKAITKLGQVMNKIGYPDRWIEYTLTFKAGQYLKNNMEALRWNYERDLKRIGKPTDKAIWEMTPATVNAYYEPSLNEMVFPAGIMQYPYFNISSPMSVNFGGVGVIMGHELTHGFDDQGRQYDGKGMLVDWWDKESKANFKERAQCVSDLYNSFEVQDLHVNGKLTLGENIADLGGVKRAYSAYHQYQDNHEQETPFIEGLTNEQLFFISYGQGWCSKSTTMDERYRIATDPHSPPKYRVIGPLSQFDEFANAFQCPVGSQMNPKDKCAVW